MDMFSTWTSPRPWFVEDRITIFVASVVTALAGFGICSLIVAYTQRKPDMPFPVLAKSFVVLTATIAFRSVATAAYVFAPVPHLLSVSYAIVAVASAVMLFKLTVTFNKLLCLPSPQEYQLVISKQVDTEMQLRETNAQLQEAIGHRALFEREVSFLRELQLSQARKEDDTSLAIERLDATIEKITLLMEAYLPRQQLDSSVGT